MHRTLNIIDFPYLKDQYYYGSYHRDQLPYQPQIVLGSHIRFLKGETETPSVKLCMARRGLLGPI